MLMREKSEVVPITTSEDGPLIQARVSLAPLLRQWENIAAADGHAAEHARRLLNACQDDPQIVETLPHTGSPRARKALLDELFSIVFPPALRSSQCAAALAPLCEGTLYTTPAFERLFASGYFNGAGAVPEPQWTFHRLMPYLIILERAYGLSIIPSEMRQCTFHYQSPDGLALYHMTRVNLDFVEVHSEGPVEPLSDTLRQEVSANALDEAFLRHAIRWQQFRLEGFVVHDICDVTYEQVMSHMRQTLLDSECLMSTSTAQCLETNLRSLFRLPGVRMRISMFDDDMVFFTTSETSENYLTGRCCRLSDVLSKECAVNLFERRATVLVDLSSVTRRTEAMNAFFDQGLRGLLRAPLVVENKVLGMFEVASGSVGDFGALNRSRFEGLLPMMSAALESAVEERNIYIQANIKQLFTNIHPSTEWRFRRVAATHMRDGQEPEDIKFDDVYPLFGVSDIRSSSTLRSGAIRDDLLQQLRMVESMLDCAHEERALPYIANLCYRVRNKIKGIEPGISSGEEMSIIEFLHKEVDPILPRLEELTPGVRDAIAAYRATLDPHLGILYQERRKFDESVTQVSQAMALCLDERQREVQALYPHHYEMHRTDGVDHSIYIGASMSESGDFDVLYLYNLRVWQLITMCILARSAEAMRPQLSMKLDVAHLVLVQSTPLTIRFNQDEKQFTVDGAYNIRYEIIKKRLDKATVKGTGERLTQPRMLAVVYAQSREAEEYRRYLAYLQDAGYLEGPIEDLALDELPGVSGLRALRAAVRMEACRAVD